MTCIAGLAPALHPQKGLGRSVATQAGDAALPLPRLRLRCSIGALLQTHHVRGSDSTVEALQPGGAGPPPPMASVATVPLQSAGAQSSR